LIESLAGEEFNPVTRQEMTVDQLDGARVGFINKDFDLRLIDSLVKDPTRPTKYSTAELVELAGTRGVGLLNWLVARGTLPAKVGQRHVNYHIPVSNTASGLLLLEPA
jgi:protocatechuate 4,5-dioxygenase beta chain